jgi:probable HAF family extracellular repeat protein
VTRSLAFTLSALLCVAVFGAATPCPAQSYSVTELGPSVIIATAISNNGQIVGAATATSDPSRSDPYILSNGTLTDIGNLGSPCCQAYAVNSLGDAVGLARYCRWWL